MNGTTNWRRQRFHCPGGGIGVNASWRCAWGLLPSSTRIEPWEYNKALYKRRNEVERLFRRLKDFRRIFSRFEKLDLVFIAFIYFALIVEELR